MIDTIYVEEEVASHPRTERILARFPRATRIMCQRYGEVFNRRAQSFRLQKQKPALILAHKHDGFVLETPSGYGIGTEHNYYFSHMLNCVYDCRYCFLQGMYQSAHYVLFVNYEDFESAVREQAGGPGESTFFSGYDCDSLAFDQVTGFVDHFLPLFEGLDRATLELRTKSVQVQGLLKREPQPGVVVAYSLTSEPIASSTEHGAPPLKSRISALHCLANHGWQVGLRFDPLVAHPEFRASYRELFERVFDGLALDRVHSVSLGPLRFPRAMFDTIVRHYPDEPLFTGPLERRGGKVSYAPEREEAMRSFCEDELRSRVGPEKLFACRTEPVIS